MVENQFCQHLITHDRYTFDSFFFLQQIFIEYLLGASCPSNPEDTLINRVDKILRKVNSHSKASRVCLVSLQAYIMAQLHAASFA